MTDLRSLLQGVLQDSGYHTWLTSLDNLEIVGFEDDAVMGFACVYDSVDTLLKEWRSIESKILTKHAPALQRAGQKTWNVYFVFLTSGPATRRNIERFDGLKKILKGQERLQVVGSQRAQTSSKYCCPCSLSNISHSSIPRISI